MELDAERVLEQADARQVIEYLGMTTQKKGAYEYISCPMHHDEHPSCVVNEKYIYCFVCGKGISCVDLVQTETGADFHSALRIIWESEGCPGDCFSTQSEKKTYYVSQNELNFLGIKYEPTVLIPIRDTEQKELNLPKEAVYSYNVNCGYRLMKRIRVQRDNFLPQNWMREKVLSSCNEKERKIEKLSQALNIDLSDEGKKVKRIREKM